MVATILSQGRFNMRKVLLATTALVALNVSAASAEVSIKGAGQFEIEDSIQHAHTHLTVTLLLRYKRPLIAV